MNILKDDSALVAAVVLARVKHTGTSRVYAKPSGQVSMYRIQDARNARVSDAFLVGTYTSQADVQDIAQDLVERRTEIAA